MHPRASKMLNAFSIDVEDYYQVEAFASLIPSKNWNNYESRVEKNVDVILGSLSKHETKATFFTLGWVAESFPSIVRKIAEAGHEVGCHGYAHQHIRRQSPEQFRQDVRSAKQCLENQAQRLVQCYRAPSFSVTASNLWALDILAEEGFRIDSSIFPIRHDLYGIPNAERFPHWREQIFEFPPTTIRLLGNNIGVAGGGYLRILPYNFTRWAIRQINEKEGQPVMVYFHPWEIDPGQPRIKAPLKARLRQYTNLDGMQGKIERLLEEFRFATVSEVCEKLEPQIAQIAQKKKSSGGI